MENASKALIIAGAILIAIVLLTVGVVVVNSFNPDDAIGEVDQRTKEVFNSKFVSNSGENVRGSAVKTLLSNVISSNASNKDENSKQISVTVDGANSTNDSNKISEIRRDINTSHKYTVTLSYADNGLVNSIDIADNDD